MPSPDVNLLHFVRFGVGDWTPLLDQLRRYWGPSVNPVLAAANGLREAVQRAFSILERPLPHQSEEKRRALVLSRAQRSLEQMRLSCRVLRRALKHWAETHWRAGATAEAWLAELDELEATVRAKYGEFQPKAPRRPRRKRARAEPGRRPGRITAAVRACAGQPTTPLQARAVMGLPLNFDRKQLNERYRMLARLYHPDLGGNADSMSAINVGYELLMRGLS